MVTTSFPVLLVGRVLGCSVVPVVEGELSLLPVRYDSVSNDRNNRSTKDGVSEKPSPHV